MWLFKGLLTYFAVRSIYLVGRRVPVLSDGTDRDETLCRPGGRADHLVLTAEITDYVVERIIIGHRRRSRCSHRMTESRSICAGLTPDSISAPLPLRLSVSTGTGQRIETARPYDEIRRRRHHFTADEQTIVRQLPQCWPEYIYDVRHYTEQSRMLNDRPLTTTRDDEAALLVG